MKFYYYLFSCAYWVSVKDLKENSSPHEYALLFISILNLLIFVIVIGLINLMIGYNILDGGIVIVVSIVIFILNYFMFIKKKKYLTITDAFKRLGLKDFKSERRRTLILAYAVAGLIAIILSASQALKVW